MDGIFPDSVMNAADNGADLNGKNEEPAKPEPSGASGDGCETDPPKSGGKKTVRTVLIALAAVLLLCAVGYALAVRTIFRRVGTVVVALDEPVRVAVCEEGFLSHLCRPEPPLSRYDTSEVGTRAGEVVAGWFFRCPLTVKVEDRTPPVMTLRRITDLPGTVFSPEDFVVSFEDRTDVTFSFAEEPDFDREGEQTVIVRALDGGGNITDADTVLTLSAEPVRWEIGGEDLTPEEAVLARMPGANRADLGGCDPTVPGTWTASGESAEERFRVLLATEDTTPPSLTLRRITDLPGADFVPEDFVLSSSDASPLSFSFVSEPDLSREGEQTVTVRAEDVSGNRTEAAAVLTLNAEPVRWELGTEDPTPEKAVLSRMPGADHADLGGCDPTVPGTWTASGESTEERFRVLLRTEDTTPPSLTLRRITDLPGTVLLPEDFIVGSADASPLTFSFAAEPDRFRVGTQTVTVCAEDESGNRTEADTVLTLNPEPLRWEMGSKDLTVEEAVLSGMPGAERADLGGCDPAVQGSWTVRGESPTERFTLLLVTEDTTPPVSKPVNREALTGTPLLPEDFVTGISDAHPVTVEYVTEPDFDLPGETAVTVRLKDTAGNEALSESVLSLWDMPARMDVESGMSAKEILDMILTSPSRADASSLRIEKGYDSALTEDGGHTVTLAGHYGTFDLYLWTEDTTPPNAKVRDFDLLLGGTVDPDTLLTDIDDVSEVTVVRLNEPDFTRPGRVQTDFTLTDAAGNSSSYTSLAAVWDIPPSVTVESGTARSGLENLLFAKTEGTAPAILEYSYDTGAGTERKTADALNLPGDYLLRLEGAYSVLEISMKVEDTTPPVLKTKNHEVTVGDGVGAWDFVSALDDVAKVTPALVSPVSTAVPGNYTVELTAADPYGNVTSGTATLTVLADTTPPVIYGVENQTVAIGSTVSLRKSVYAEDAKDGPVAVQVDSSKLNTSVPGIYEVIYTAADTKGNTAEVSAYITVRERNIDDVNALADSVLADIRTHASTERQIAWAIYVWCSSNIRYSTSTAYLMGNYVLAAYSGFTTYAGNCYTYYAVSAALLTRAGIENMMIQRNIPDRPHYWNLVKIDGSWYHFDSCPHYDYAPLESFLLTDAEVIDYSTNAAEGYYSFDSSLYPATP